MIFLTIKYRKNLKKNKFIIFRSAPYFAINKIQIISLDLSYNNLENIENYVFYDSSYLAEINFKNNRIQNISDHAFEKCTNLKKIILSKNNLVSLNEVLRSITSLRILYVDNNNLNQLYWDEIPEELEELYAGNNYIQFINEAKNPKIRILKVFYNFKILKKLNLVK